MRKRKRKPSTGHKQTLSTPELQRRLEDFFRPNRILGYNRNTLAVYLIERGAYPIAESELRRAIWLNPFEAVFKANLAWCVFKQGNKAEAEQWIREAIQQDSHQEAVRRLFERIIGSDELRDERKEPAG
jgi:Flp pilus assembly protein TadD